MNLVRTAILTTLTTLLLSLSLSTPSWAQWGFPPQQPAASEQDVQDVQHQLDLLKKDFERLQSQTDRDLSAHKERISDLHAKADWLGLLMAAITIFIAVGATISFFSAAKNAVRKARGWLMDEAKNETQKLSADLVKDSRAELEKHIAELEAELKSKIDEHVRVAKCDFDTMMADTENKHQEAQAMLARAQDAMQKGDGSKFSDSDKQALRKAAQDIDAKPEPERTYEDWSVRAAQAYFAEDFETSAIASDHAAQAADATREDVATALVNKGAALIDAGHMKEALVAFETVIDRFGNLDDSGLRVQLSWALGNIGFTRLAIAKEAWQTPGRADEAQELLTRALVDVEAALVYQPNDLFPVGNQGYALFLLGREDEAEAPLRRALELGGEKALHNALADAKIHPLPQDKAFVALVRRLWDEVQAAQSDA